VCDVVRESRPSVNVNPGGVREERANRPTLNHSTQHVHRVWLIGDLDLIVDGLQGTKLILPTFLQLILDNSHD
jgi:hypothetical protein